LPAPDKYGGRHSENACYRGGMKVRKPDFIVFLLEIGKVRNVHFDWNGDVENGVDRIN
jgi:hypothetical protein